MKLNGALMPRHGASSKESSLGAELLRNYRDKRYPLDTCKYVANACLPSQQQHQQRRHQFNEGGVNNNNNNNNCKSKNYSNNNYYYNNNSNSNLLRLKEQQQQQEQPPPQEPQLLQQQERRHRKACDENILGGGDNNSPINKNTTQNRLKSVTATRTTTIIDYINSHGSEKSQTSIRATVVAVAASSTSTSTTTTSARVKTVNGQTRGNRNEGGLIIELKNEQQTKNTTRQTNTKSISNDGDKLYLSKHNWRDNPERTTTIGVGKEFPIAYNHVTGYDKGKSEPETGSKSKKHSNNNNNYKTTSHIGGRVHCWKEVNKLSFIWQIYEPLRCWRALTLSTVIISRLFKQFKSFLLWLGFFMYITGNPVGDDCSGGSGGRGGVENGGRACRRTDRAAKSSSLANIMRASQSFVNSMGRIYFQNASTSRPPFMVAGNSIAFWLLVCGAAATILLPQKVLADEGDNFFSPNDIAIGESTTEFDYASRGQKKFGDKCDNTLECGFPGSICDTRKKSCQCTEDLPVTNHIDKCGKEAAVNESCFFNEQCEVKYFQTECRDGRCVCRFDMTPIWLKDGTVECKGRQDKKGPETYIDPAMIGVLVGMALMFIIICVVLRLFSQARWRENRTIFNTPNPRLMNVSLLRESKLLHGQERRGSRMSVRAPSRQPSMASLRPHSPNPSLGKTGSRSNSHGSNGSATSLRSTRSNSVSPAMNNAHHHERKGSTYHPHQHHPPPTQPAAGSASLQQQQQQQLLQQPNIIANPVAESVTVEIIEPEK